MYKVTRHCDFCGNEMPKIEDIRELSVSPTKEWNLCEHASGLAICSTCAMKLDYTFAKFKLSVLQSKVGDNHA